MLFCDNNLGIALASQAACPLFAKLSLELRNQIYEHVFTTDEATDKDLETAKASEHGATCYLLANVYSLSRTASTEWHEQRTGGRAPSTLTDWARTC